jgi:glycosyltransferase involved in cell wall biosynthesis
MNIAFDAKRIFQNKTGLGNYSRTLATSLSQQFPNNKYFLYAPRKTDLYNIENSSNLEWVGPTDIFSKQFPSIWRSKLVCKDLLRDGIDIYHGLSHEIPQGLQHTKIKTIVTIHDLIFERYPSQYNPIDVLIHRRKIKFACKHSHAIIAISEQTKKDLIDFYHVDPNKIIVCYQSCSNTFFEEASSNQIEEVRKKYRLPKSFFLYVGSIIERKNLLTICKALNLINKETRIPLVVVGKGKSYLQKVKKYITANGLEHDVLFLAENKEINSQPDFLVERDLANIYRCATGLIYPSVFEGFGIPLLEAMSTGTPVITSNVSCMPEVGDDAVLYINPYDEKDMVMTMEKLITDSTLRSELSEKGKKRAMHFTWEKCATAVMEVYLK